MVMGNAKLAIVLIIKRNQCLARIVFLLNKMHFDNMYSII